MLLKKKTKVFFEKCFVYFEKLFLKHILFKNVLEKYSKRLYDKKSIPKVLF